jgi:hypothetical protein
MPENYHDIGGYIRENVRLGKDYFETRLEIARLRVIRVISKSAGYIIWMIASLFLAFLAIIFLGIVSSIWLSELTGSFVMGFSLTTLGLLALLLVTALFRKSLFINPVIRAFLRNSRDETDEDENK